MSGQVNGRCSWSAVPELAAVLRVTRAERSTGESGELRGGEIFVTLERVPKSGDETPCFLYLQCDPQGHEEILSVVVVSQARNMEVYAKDEYVGTSRGEEVCITANDSGSSTFAFYKKFLKMESPTPVCKVKLSLGGKERLLLSKIDVQLTASTACCPKSFSALGTSIDLDQVQTMMDCMGCKLSPGAQQLLSMVQQQQKQNPLPFGMQLQGLGCACRVEQPMQRMTLLTDCMQSLQQSVAPVARPAGFGSSAELPGKGGSWILNQQCVPQVLEKLSSEGSDVPKADLLPLLQSLCDQVSHMRLEERSVESKPEAVKSKEGTGNSGNEQPACSYLESVVAKSLARVQKQLLAHIDDRMDRLTERMDAQFALLTGFLQNFHPTGVLQGQDYLLERLTRSKKNLPNS